jgi:hypothetical protein
MGQVVTTDRSQHDVTVDVTGLGPDGKVRLLQFEIREPAPPGTPQYLNPVVLRDEYLQGTLSSGTFTDTVSVDTQLPSFVRIEAWDDRGELAFSNPIYFVHAVPDAGVPAERVAARLGDVRLFLAEAFRLTGASFDEGTAVLSIAGDETTPGAGQLSIDPGMLGAPTSVLGASGWTYVSGVLTLSGFEGVGSTVQVTWGPTGVTADAPSSRELSLAPGRPNPFGAGTLAEFVLPERGFTRLEVLDVAGRRVRTLVAGFREAGLFRERWDGRDEGGRQVADGVYWLRLTHDGKSLTRKTVRVH